jgi:glucuronokinase
MIIKTHAYARAGLIGNPSDGFFGKTISVILRNYRAEATLYESPELRIEPSPEDFTHLASLKDLVREVKRHGYYGGMRLAKAAIKRFADYCDEHGIELENRNFTIRYTTNIPRLVGMAGSSAIVTAVVRALMAFYGVEIPKPHLANLILSAEKSELGISAGLQDRVIQVYEGVVFMDFSKELMDRQGYGRYEPIAPNLLPPLYIAFDANRAESSEWVHNPVRTLFEKGDRKVLDAMQGFAELTEKTRTLLLARRGHEIGPLLNANFDLRTTIYNIAEGNRSMVMTARRAGASAKFAGSGGAIIGTYEDETMFRALEKALNGIGCVVFKPEIA